MAGLAAAWELSKPDRHDHIESVTVYQRGWRLGGKGASSRARYGRVEEHGLHVWLGYYENAFRLMRECYDALDRAHTDPNAPIIEWTDGFVASSQIGLGELHGTEWLPWIASFSEDDEGPGSPAATSAPMTTTEFTRRGLSLLRDFVVSLPAGSDQLPSGPALVITTDPVPPRPRPTTEAADRLVRDAGLLALAGALELLATIRDGSDALLPDDDRLTSFVQSSLDAIVDRLRVAIAARLRDDVAARRVWHVVDLIAATLRGIVADGLLVHPDGFAAIDDWDYRDWIGHHGATRETLDSPLVRGVYDLVFGYEDGDDGRPRFAAGTGLLLSAKLFFDYRGAIFWKMAAGMGEVVFAPLYEVLARQGVRFEFFHRVDRLGLSDDGARIDSVDLGVQAQVRDAVGVYDPLVRVGGLPSWPAEPRHELLDGTDESAPEDFESLWSARPDADSLVLRAGDDFDVIVLAIPVGMHRYICNELIENPRTPQWRAMTQGLGTVATQAMQLWLSVDEGSLGSPVVDSTMSGYPGAFHTHASMSHLLDVEQWPLDDRPASILYFCHALATAEPPDRTDAEYPQRELARVRAHAVEFLRHDLALRLPQSVRNADFRWDLLCGAGSAIGPARLDAQFLRANVDPSDRYVLSLPGTGRHRLRADESGYDNLVLAGDWIDSGLNAGCIEAAVISGVQAANAVMDRELLEGVTGFYLAHHGRAGRPWKASTGAP